MFSRSSLVITFALILVLTIAACGRDKATDEPPQPGATQPLLATTVEPVAAQGQPAGPAPGPSPSPAVAQAPTQTQTTPTPPPAVNGAGPVAAQASIGSATEELPTVDVVKILTPSVVQIVTEVLSMGLFNQPTPSRGVGTGVILDGEGRILTNNHVIAGAQSITVTLNNGESYPASIVGRDPNTDLAVIRIVADGLTPAALGSSSALEVGQDVIAIGHALGLQGGPTVSKGVVSALGRSIDSDQGNTIVDLIQTDASINPGNSGGALANHRAEVVGINTAIIQGTQGIGFAINIDDAKVVVAQLIEQGFVQRGYLGIGPTTVNPGLADRFGLPVTEGIMVVRVLPGTPAARAGLSEEDVIVQLGEQPIDNTGELSRFLIAHLPGETVALIYFRGQTKVSTQITLGERPQE